MLLLRRTPEERTCSHDHCWHSVKNATRVPAIIARLTGPRLVLRHHVADVEAHPELVAALRAPPRRRLQQPPHPSRAPCSLLLGGLNVAVEAVHQADARGDHPVRVAGLGQPVVQPEPLVRVDAAEHQPRRQLERARAAALCRAVVPGPGPAPAPAPLGGCDAAIVRVAKRGHLRCSRLALRPRPRRKLPPCQPAGSPLWSERRAERETAGCGSRARSSAAHLFFISSCPRRSRASSARSRACSLSAGSARAVPR